jgi:RHS repeat-associated protein
MYDEKGQLTWEARLDIYGKVSTFAGRSLDDCPFRYQGQYEDSETGLYYNRFRYYLPEEGIYLSQDPIGLNGGNALYTYVHNSNNYVDVFGLAEANNGAAPQHGGVGHNKIINTDIAQLRRNGATNIRKNQQQVDINGNTVGKNRPDIQFDKNGIHYNIEYDTTTMGSLKHQNQIPMNDPNARNTFWMIDENGNKITGHSQCH